MSEVTVIKNPESGIEKRLESMFAEHKALADEWLQKAQTLVVTDESQTDLMDQSRTARLALRSIRINMEKLHKREKHEFLIGGRMVDDFKNKYVGLITPIEEILLKNENFIEIQEEKRKEEVQRVRLKECLPLIGNEALSLPLGELSEIMYRSMLLGFQRQAEEKEHARLDEIRIMKEKDEEAKANTARIQKENDRLREEAKKKQAEVDAQAARDKADRDKLEQKLMKERSERKRLEEEEKARLQVIEDEKKEKAVEARKFKRAPDKEKLLQMVIQVDELYGKFESTKFEDEESQKIVKASMKVLTDLAANISKFTLQL